MATPRFVSAYNGFVPQATGQTIGYIRQPTEFALNRYVQYLETPATVGLYAKIHPDNAVAVVDDSDYVWADGDDRPSGDWDLNRWEWKEFSVTRRSYNFRVGHMAIAQAKDTWKPVEVETQTKSSKAMVNRTNRIMTLLQTASNWGANTDSATSLNGGAGKWDTASSEPGVTYNAIYKSLQEAARQINLATNGVVRPRDLVLVISPGLAKAMANAPEIHNYLKFGPFSRKQLEGKDNYNMEWGLPPSLYGFELVCEDCIRVSSRPKADATTALTDGTRTYVKADDSAILLSRKGGINGSYGFPSFSTVQLYWYEYEMKVEIFDDPENARLKGSITDAFAEVLAAPEAGYLITSVL